MNDLFLTYKITEHNNESKYFSIFLHDPFNRPSRERLPSIHDAVAKWAGNHAGVVTFSDLSQKSKSGSLETQLTDYLYGNGNFNADRLIRHLEMFHRKENIHRYTLRPGAPAEGQDIVGRENEMQKIHDLLHDDKSIHLRAPRRYGKTTTLRKINGDLNATRQCSIHVDLIANETAVGLFAAIAMTAMDHSSCRKNLRKIRELARWPGKSENITSKNQARQRLANQIKSNVWSFANRLLLRLGESKAILLLDEFSVFLKSAVEANMDEAKQLCQRLFLARTQSPVVRQVLCGSSGLAAYMGFYDLNDEFSDLHPVELNPLNVEQSSMLTEELLYGAGIIPTPSLIRNVLDELGEPVPYFIHALVDALRMEIISSSRAPNKAAVKTAYRDRLMGPTGNFWFRIYRLDSQPYPENQRKAAKKIMKNLAIKPEGLPEEELFDLYQMTLSRSSRKKFNILMACLEEDFDLVKEDDIWRMRSKVLRDRWALNEAWLTEG
jgi:hypothetical protein